jgi:hypothetical protein
MRVLLATCASDDYLSACLYDGLQELLGEGNVSDAGFTGALHAGHNLGPCARVGAWRVGRRLDASEGAAYDLLILNACLTRDHPDWHWAAMLRECHLRPGGRVALVEGHDGYNEVHLPPFECDAYFRRELDPTFPYPYPKAPHCLMMGAPRRWFELGEHERPIDVYYTAASLGTSHRWDVCAAAYQTKTRHRSIVGSTGVGMELYFSWLVQSKIALCPAGAGNCADCLRTWEVVAKGAIPVFVGYPERTRDPWFEPDTYRRCPDASALPETIDALLSMPPAKLADARRRLLATALQDHTTVARAKRLLELTGF